MLHYFAKVSLSETVVDSLLKQMVDVVDVVEPNARNSDKRNEVSLPREGSSDREAERETPADGRLASELRKIYEELEATPKASEDEE